MFYSAENFQLHSGRWKNEGCQWCTFLTLKEKRKKKIKYFLLLCSYSFIPHFWNLKAWLEPSLTFIQHFQMSASVRTLPLALWPLLINPWTPRHPLNPPTETDTTPVWGEWCSFYVTVHYWWDKMHPETPLGWWAHWWGHHSVWVYTVRALLEVLTVHNPPTLPHPPCSASVPPPPAFLNRPDLHQTLCTFRKQKRYSCVSKVYGDSWNMTEKQKEPSSVWHLLVLISVFHFWWIWQ